MSDESANLILTYKSLEDRLEYVCHLMLECETQLLNLCLKRHSSPELSEPLRAMRAKILRLTDAFDDIAAKVIADSLNGSLLMLAAASQKHNASTRAHDLALAGINLSCGCGVLTETVMQGSWIESNAPFNETPEQINDVNSQADALMQAIEALVS